MAIGGYIDTVTYATTWHALAFHLTGSLPCSNAFLGYDYISSCPLKALGVRMLAHSHSHNPYTDSNALIFFFHLLLRPSRVVCILLAGPFVQTVNCLGDGLNPLPLLAP